MVRVVSARTARPARSPSRRAARGRAGHADRQPRARLPRAHPVRRGGRTVDRLTVEEPLVGLLDVGEVPRGAVGAHGAAGLDRADHPGRRRGDRGVGEVDRHRRAAERGAGGLGEVGPDLRQRQRLHLGGTATHGLEGERREHRLPRQRRGGAQAGVGDLHAGLTGAGVRRPALVGVDAAVDEAQDPGVDTEVEVVGVEVRHAVGGDGHGDLVADLQGVVGDAHAHAGHLRVGGRPGAAPPSRPRRGPGRRRGRGRAPGGAVAGGLLVVVGQPEQVALAVVAAQELEVDPGARDRLGRARLAHRHRHRRHPGVGAEPQVGALGAVGVAAGVDERVEVVVVEQSRGDLLPRDGAEWLVIHASYCSGVTASRVR